MTKIKTITSHTGLSRWLAETSEDPVAWLARAQCANIPSPYAYSPSKAIIEWKGKQVVYFEVSHKRYEIFEVPAGMLRFKTDDEATDWHINNTRTAR